jgi:hypothetical protein
VGYEDSDPEDGSPRQKNATQFNEFSEMGRVNKENEDSVSTVMWQPFYLKPFSPNTYEVTIYLTQHIMMFYAIFWVSSYTNVVECNEVVV